jgi:hypothetical protein
MQCHSFPPLPLVIGRRCKWKWPSSLILRYYVTFSFVIPRRMSSTRDAVGEITSTSLQDLPPLRSHEHAALTGPRPHNLHGSTNKPPIPVTHGQISRSRRIRIPTESTSPPAQCCPVLSSTSSSDLIDPAYSPTIDYHPTAHLSRDDNLINYINLIARSLPWTETRTEPPWICWSKCDDHARTCVGLDHVHRQL